MKTYIYIYIYILESSGALRAPLILWMVSPRRPSRNPPRRVTISHQLTAVSGQRPLLLRSVTQFQVRESFI